MGRRGKSWSKSRSRYLETVEYCEDIIEDDEVGVESKKTKKPGQTDQWGEDKQRFGRSPTSRKKTKQKQTKTLRKE